MDDNRNEINLGTKMQIGPKCRDQKCIYAYFRWLVYYILLLFFFLSKMNKSTFIIRKSKNLRNYNQPNVLKTRKTELTSPTLSANDQIP